MSSNKLIPKWARACCEKSGFGVMTFLRKKKKNMKKRRKLRKKENRSPNCEKNTAFRLNINAKSCASDESYEFIH